MTLSFNGVLRPNPTIGNEIDEKGVSQTIDKNGQPSSEGIVGYRGSLKRTLVPFLSR